MAARAQPSAGPFRLLSMFQWSGRKNPVNLLRAYCAMPDDLHKKLTKRELRDVVEFLAGLKEPEKKGNK